VGYNSSLSPAIPGDGAIQQYTMRKAARTISGVTPVAVMSRPAACPGQCLYCPTFATTPQSYTPESPAVLRAINCDYDGARQVTLRLKILAEMGHPTDKVELIVMGGTFLACPVDYQYKFIKDCYDALNRAISTSLEEAKRLNEASAHRCVGLCIETRPDWCRQEEIDRMLDFGATRVELGVQMLDDDIYRLVRRGHSIADVAAATRRLKEHGFKVYYHWMPGLPGSTPEKDLALSEILFADDRFKPDGLKLYPTMVVAGTELEKWYLAGSYQPYGRQTMTDLMVDIKSLVPRYVRISRVLRDIPSRFITAGLKDSLRDTLRERMEQRGIDCRCIRCREYGHRQRQGILPAGNPLLKRMDYPASGGREVFLTFEDKAGTLYGSLRLRLQQKSPARLGTSGPAALVRELHIYGPEVALGTRVEAAPQHQGLGRALLEEAEKIAVTESGAVAIYILSGTGARGYYRDISGYRLNVGYMVKELVQKKPLNGMVTDTAVRK
jgi:elongator complex protein 3